MNILYIGLFISFDSLNRSDFALLGSTFLLFFHTYFPFDFDYCSCCTCSYSCCYNTDSCSLAYWDIDCISDMCYIRSYSAYKE